MYQQGDTFGSRFTPWSYLAAAAGSESTMQALLAKIKHQKHHTDMRTPQLFNCYHITRLDAQSQSMSRGCDCQIT